MSDKTDDGDGTDGEDDEPKVTIEAGGKVVDATDLFAAGKDGGDKPLFVKGQEVMFDKDAHAGDFTELYVGKTLHPVIQVLKVGGSFKANREMNLGERVLVTVADEDGEIVGTAYCEIAVGHKNTHKADFTFVERVHTANVEKA